MKTKIVKLTLVDGSVKYVGMLKTGWFRWKYLNGVFKERNKYYTYHDVKYIDKDHRYSTIKEAQENIDRVLELITSSTVISIEDVKP